MDLVVLSTSNKVVLFNTNQINAVGSKNTKGVQVLKLKENSLLKLVKELNKTELQDAEYYRKGLNVIGYLLKSGDKV